MKRESIFIVLVALILSACGVKAEQDANALATLIQQGIEQTLAAASPTPQPTSTSFPTATPLPTAAKNQALKIAFVSNESGAWQIYTANSDGSAISRATNNPDVEGTFNYSPDGKMIAYETYLAADGNAEIYLMNADGTEMKKLVATSKNDFRPAWSPDGRKILFSSDMTQDMHDRDIFVINSDGTGLINLSQSTNFDVDPVWSPDSTRIAYRSGAYLSDEDLANFSVSNKTKIIVQNVQSGEKIILPTPGGLAVPSSPQWSPDGSQIVFNCGGMNEKPDDPDSFANYQGICIAALDGSSVQVIYQVEVIIDTSKLTYHPDPIWSPDGSKIAFVGLLKDGTTQIFTINPDGSDQRQLTTGEMEIKFAPAWSKNGTMLLFLTKQGSLLRPRFAAYTMQADGSLLTQIVQTSQYSPWPIWLEQFTKYKAYCVESLISV